MLNGIIIERRSEFVESSRCKIAPRTFHGPVVAGPLVCYLYFSNSSGVRKYVIVSEPSFMVIRRNREINSIF